MTQHRRGLLIELVLIFLTALLYAGPTLLTLDGSRLQQTGEHNEAATLLVLAEIGVRRDGIIPRWNPYMSSGFPHAGDLVSSFFNPIVLLPVSLFGGVNGYRISAFLAFLAAGYGQWLFGLLLGLRRTARLWSALLFMLSGGLGLLWRLGWHQLLIGVVWFPLIFASLIWALRRRDQRSLAVAALAIGMALTSAGGYYFLYLFVLLGALTLALIAQAPRGERWLRFRRAATIGALTAALLAVVLVPGFHVLRHTARETAGDPNQLGSLPVIYALFQYAISDPDWFSSDFMGQVPQGSWFYIGSLPIVALAFLPLATTRSRLRRHALIWLAILLAILFLWQANRYPPVRWLYDAYPALTTFRFPGRLLVAATSPLLVLAAFGLQALWGRLGGWLRPYDLHIIYHQHTESRQFRLRLGMLAQVALLLALFANLLDVFRVNQGFVFTPNQTRDQTPVKALTWLRQHDPSLYYIATGDYRIWWWWTATAYEFEQPVLNFAYNRHVRAFLNQQSETAIIRARPKYVFPWPDQQVTGGTLLRDFDGASLYEMPDALPFAFAIAPERLTQGTAVTPPEVAPLEARWETTDRLVVRATDGTEGQQLVALATYYPGWRVLIDGVPAELTTVNDYLGVRMRGGAHTYTFVFQPPLFTLGLLVSLGALAIAGAMLAGLTRQPLSLKRLRRLQPGWPRLPQQPSS